MSHRKVLTLCLTLLACGACGSSGKSSTIVPAYLAGDSCHDLATTAACAAQTGCRWIDVATIPCPNNSNACPTGQCVAVDPCGANSDQKSCEADTADRCLWAAVETLCPAGSNCSGDGFCFQAGDGGGSGGGCACACPDYCLEGQPCPPCSCDCPSPPPIAMDAGTATGGGGGGTCTCACPACAPGETCPPCDCNCNPPPGGGGGGCPGSTGGTGGSGGGTCTCNCPSCPPGETCPDTCTCDCAGDAGVPMSTPGSGSGSGHKEPIRPCDSFADQSDCLSATYCAWYPNTRPCMEGQPCPAGWCYDKTTTDQDAGPSSCVCACPACAPDLDGGVCPPCNCDCPPPPPMCN